MRAALAALASLLAFAPPPKLPAEWTRPIAPFPVIDNVYYVGTEELGSFLIHTSEGGILVDGGVAANADTVAGSIAALGFSVRDVRIILTTQAHYDHVGAFARLKALSRATILVSQGDAPLVEHGGRGDFFFGPDYYFPRAHVDGIVTDGRVVSLGAARLTAHLTPGHTKGCTTWTMEVAGPADRPLQACFVGSPTVNPDVRLVGNAKYPHIADDYRHTFAVLKSLRCDVFLPAHLSYINFLDLEKQAKAGAGRRRSSIPGDTATSSPRWTRPSRRSWRPRSTSSAWRAACSTQDVVQRSCKQAAVILAPAVLAAGLWGCSGSGRLDVPSRKLVPEAVRARALAAAQVWHQPGIPPEQVDFSGNGTYPGAFAADADVDCVFERRAVTGTTPKFYCRTAAGDRLKIKYGAGNPEIPAQFAASRLLDALGFDVDRMNIVHSVRCRGCPDDPFPVLECASATGLINRCLTGVATTRTATFSHVLIERSFAGRAVEASADEGWSFYELDRIDPRAGGSARREIDALRLLAVLLADWDNKGANQRLVCPDGEDLPDGGCRAAVAVLHDLGATFGPLKADLPSWERVPIWDDPRACRVSMKTLPFQGATFGSAVISEPGRQLALTLLRAVTPSQLDALFTTSGMTQYEAVVSESRRASAWTQAFQAKVQAIADGGPCPSLPGRP